MPSTSSEDCRAPSRLALAGLLLAASCTFTTAPCHPRPVVAPLAATAAIPAVPMPTLSTFTATSPGQWCGCLVGSGEQVQFQLRRTDGERRPLVVLVPILAGGEELMDNVATRMQSHGYDVAFCARVAGALKVGQRGRDLDELFRRTVLHQRLLLRWLRAELPEAPELFALGISLGGMVTTVLAAHEPDLAGVAICLSGGNIKELIAHSSERRVQAWRQWRLDEDAVGDDHLRQELEQCLVHEPLHFAPMVATERVLLVRATFDTVIPGANQDLLWESLGRPTRLSVPFGHYSSALAFNTILDAVAAHFDARRLAVAPAVP